MYGHMLSFLLGKYLGVESYDSCTFNFVTFNFQAVSQSSRNFAFPPAVYDSSNSY